MRLHRLGLPLRQAEFLNEFDEWLRAWTLDFQAQQPIGARTPKIDGGDGLSGPVGLLAEAESRVGHQ